MSGQAVGSFIQGVFGGIDARQGWEDRKEDQARRKRADAIIAAQEGRAQSAFDMAQRRDGLALTEYERQLNDEAARRADVIEANRVSQESFDAQQAGLGAVPPTGAQGSTSGALDLSSMDGRVAAGLASAAPPNVSTSTSGQQVPPRVGNLPPEVVAGVAEQLGAVPSPTPMPPTPSAGPAFEAVGRGPAPMPSPAPQQATPAPVPISPPIPRADLEAMVAQGQMMPDPDQALRPYVRTARQGVDAEQLQGRIEAYTPPVENTPAAREEAMARMNGAVLGGVESGMGAVRQAIAPDYNYQFFQPAGAGSDVVEAAKRVPAVASNVLGGVRDFVVDNVASGGAAARDYLADPMTNYLAGVEQIPGSPYSAPDGNAANRAAWSKDAASVIPSPPSFGGTGLGAVRANDPSVQTMQPPAPAATVAPAAENPSEVAVAQVAQTSLATSSPAVAAAVETAPTAVLGALASPDATEAQRTRAAGSFMDHFREVGAPVVINGMLERGDMEGAMKFQEYMDQEASKSAMENWAKATFSAANGDMETFQTAVVEGLNDVNAFGNDVEVVKAGSEFTRDAQDNIIGAVLQLRDTVTGNTFEQVMDGPDDLVALGVHFLSPEVQFDYYRQRAAAMGEAQLGAGKAAETQAAADENTIMDMAKTIFDGSKDAGLTGGTPLTYGEAMVQARDALQQYRTGVMPQGGDLGLGAPPPMYRP